MLGQARQAGQRGADGDELELAQQPDLIGLGEPAHGPARRRAAEARQRLGADGRAGERADRLEDGVARCRRRARAGRAPRGDATAPRFAAAHAAARRAPRSRRRSPPPRGCPDRGQRARWRPGSSRPRFPSRDTHRLPPRASQALSRDRPPRDSASTRVVGEQRLIPRAAVAPAARDVYVEHGDRRLLAHRRRGWPARRRRPHRPAPATARSARGSRASRARRRLPRRSAPGCACVMPARRPLPGATRGSQASTRRASRPARSRRAGCRRRAPRACACSRSRSPSTRPARARARNRSRRRRCGRRGRRRARATSPSTFDAWACIAHVRECLLGDAEEVRARRRSRLRRHPIVEPVGRRLPRARSTSNAIARATERPSCSRPGGCSSKTRCRSRAIESCTGFSASRKHLELVGIADLSPQHLQAHAHRGDDLDRVVVDALGDPPALELAGGDELAHQISADPPSPGQGRRTRPRGQAMWERGCPSYASNLR